MLNDLRYAIRTLARTPAFTLTAVITLALGIGANAAMFSVVNAVLLRPLPFADPNRLMLLYSVRQRSGRQVRASPLDFLDWRREAQSVDGMAAHVGTGFTFSGGDTTPELVIGQQVTQDFFRVVGVEPAIGRSFTADEFAPGRDRAIILSHGLWQRRYGGDRSFVGRTVTVNDKPYVIVGVMPAGFSYPTDRYQLWVPLSLTPSPDGLPVNRGAHFLQVVARLKPGVSAAHAQAEMTTIADRLAAQYADSNRDLGARIVPLRDEIVGDVQTALLVLLGAVGFVVLIACGNVTNLLLARATGRQRELAIRAALGAGRSRLVRQLFAETAVLYAAGGASAIGIARGALAVLVTVNPGDIPRLAGATIDASVLGVTSAVSLATALLFGLAPAIHCARAEIGDAIKAPGRTGSASGGRQRLRAALVVGQLALSMVLLAGAGLAMRSFVRLTSVDPGFDADGQLTFGLAMPTSRYSTASQLTAFASRLTADLASAPGVRHVGAITHLPFSGQNLENSFTVEGFDVRAGGDGPIAGLRGVNGDYFAALGIPLKRGRVFTNADRDETARVAIVNETFARRYWGAQDPIGKRLKLGDADSTDPWRVVVGVVGDVKHTGPAAETRPEVDVPYAQLEPGLLMTFARDLSYVVRGTLPRGDALALVRARVRDADAAMPLTNVQTVAQLASGVVARPRFRTALLGVFAWLALTLAAVGVFGVLSYFVTQRSREIGVRLALGAQRSDVVRMIVAKAVALAAAGAAIGLVLAIPLSRSMSALLFQAPAFDLVTFTTVGLTLVGVAGIASYCPARRAARVDPAVALRME